MKSVIGRRLLPWSDFATILAETESIVNSRPITYVYADLESRSVILRPIDFLIDQLTKSGLPISSEEPVFRKDLGDAGKRLASYWIQKRQRLQKLWEIWYDEYLLSMRESGSAYHRKPRSEAKIQPQVGEIVLVKDQDVPRGSWKLARISRLIESKDGKIRSAEVTLGNDLKLRRSIKHLYPLECHQFENRMPNNSTPDIAVPFSERADQSDDSEGFEGFTDEDVRRTLEMLQQFPDDQ